MEPVKYICDCGAQYSDTGALLACANSNHGKGWALLSVLREVEAERHRQVTKEGYTAQHDDEHTDGAIAIGAAAYCLSAATCGLAPDIWPFERDAFKPRGGRDDLIRAAAMIVAEIERLDRGGKNVGRNPQ